MAAKYSEDVEMEVEVDDEKEDTVKQRMLENKGKSEENLPERVDSKKS